MAACMASAGAIRSTASPARRRPRPLRPIRTLALETARRTRTFQLAKTYGASFAPWRRDIRKPVAGSVRLAVGGSEQAQGSAFTVDHATGLVTFALGHVPADGAVVTAGFEFDVPVRFDTDSLEVGIQGFEHGAIPAIPLIEIRV